MGIMGVFIPFLLNITVILLYFCPECCIQVPQIQTQKGQKRKSSQALCP